MIKEYKMYINGQWQSNMQYFDVINPATEEIIATVAKAKPQDVDKAVQVALHAFSTWKQETIDSRATFMHHAAAKVMTHIDELTTLLTQEQGKPLEESRAEVEWTAKTMVYYAELAKNELGRMAPPIGNTQLNLIIREPYGVVGAITPFNYPLLLLMWKAAPALMMGNTLVIKPSDLTPLSTLRMLELCFDGFPSGVINCVPGSIDAGKTLVSHPDVPLIAFTGSTATGTDIIRQTAAMNKKLHLEMGGKDAFVVAPGENVHEAASAIAWSGFFNNGQVCTSTERVYVHKSAYNEFITSLVEKVKKLRLGNGLDDSCDLGPMISAQGYKKLDAQIDDAIAKGAKVEMGTGRAKEFDKGYYYSPTVLSNVDHTMLCMQEESFGPIVCVMAYDTFEEAIALVNDSPYGLGACCRTSQPLLAKQFYEGVKAGTIWINDPLPDNIAAPFGGMKLSGNTRELGIEGLHGFAEQKHIHWELDLAIKDHWIK